MDKWQPIETAPKDGTGVLLYRNMPFSSGEVYEVVSVYWAEWLENWRACGTEEVVDQYGEPFTHWMPLPAPPEESENG